MIAAALLLATLSGTPQIEQSFTAAVERLKIPGAAIGVVVDGKLAYLKTYGVRDVATNAPVTPETRFRIASMTKSFTAVAILQLRDAGKLSLDDPVAKYIPELAKLAYPTKDSPVITIRHLLTHSEGFPEDNPWGDRQMAQTNAEMDRWMRAGIPFSNAPGIAYEYSNYGFAILGRIVARVSGQPYDQYVTAKILKPLGMTSSTLRVEDVPKEHIAYGYRWEGGDKPVLQEPLAHGSFGAMGGMWTTPGDLAKWVAFMLDAFPPRDDADNGPLRRSSRREMQQFHRFASATATRASLDGPLQMTASAYGYGLRISRDCRFDHIVGHGGGLPGYGSYMQWLPDYGVGVITFANLTYSGLRNINDEAFNYLALTKRPIQPAPALLAIKNDVTSLVTKWDDALFDRIAADNLIMDETAAKRRERIAEALTKVGACKPGERFDVENALRGEWRMTCERGELAVSVTLAPTMPPRVQSLNIRPIVPLTADDVQRAIAASSSARYGTCTAGAPIDTGVITLNCEKGNLRARVTPDKVELIPARDKNCVP